MTAVNELTHVHTCPACHREQECETMYCRGWTQKCVLIVDDPDAPVGTWVHWVLYRIPFSARELPEGVPAQDTVPRTGTQGTNDFKRVGYGGPCPPRGPAHRYFFKLYALDTELALSARKTKADVLKAIDGHVLAQTELVGRYKRK
jgi:Raf kinase inhibitor-like YbhB/YbcL family protein